MRRRVFGSVLIILSFMVVILSMVSSEEKDVLYYNCRFVERASEIYYLASKFYTLTEDCDTLDIRLWAWDSSDRILLNCGIDSIWGRTVKLLQEEASPYEKKTNKCAIEIGIVKKNCYVKVAFWHYVTNYVVFIAYDIETDDLIGYTEGYF